MSTTQDEAEIVRLGADDRLELEVFAAACKSRAKPGRDAYGAHHLRGRYGVIFASGTGGRREFTILCGVDIEQEVTPREWSAVKRSRAFADLTQDGDSEGAFLLHRVPSATEGTALRKALGLPMAYSEQELQRRRDLGIRHGFGSKDRPSPQAGT